MTKELELNDYDLADINSLLWAFSNSIPSTRQDRELARTLQDKIGTLRLYNANIEKKRQVISDHYHTSMVHPAIKQMSAERVEQTYDRLVEQGKITVGEN